MSAVKRPGSLYLSARAVYAFQACLTALSLLIGGSFLEREATISIAVSKILSRSPLVSSLYQRFPGSVLTISGSPLSNCGISPYISAWSLTTKKSSGRESFARKPCVVVTSSPRAKRKASSCPSRFMVPASTETIVWRCVSPHNTRVGNSRPTYGEYSFLPSVAATPALSGR